MRFFKENLFWRTSTYLCARLNELGILGRRHDSNPYERNCPQKVYLRKSWRLPYRRVGTGARAIDDEHLDGRSGGHR